MHFYTTGRDSTVLENCSIINICTDTLIYRKLFHTKHIAYSKVNCLNLLISWLINYLVNKQKLILHACCTHLITGKKRSSCVSWIDESWIVAHINGFLLPDPWSSKIVHLTALLTHTVLKMERDEDDLISFTNQLPPLDLK